MKKRPGLAVVLLLIGFLLFAGLALVGLTWHYIGQPIHRDDKRRVFRISPKQSSRQVVDELVRQEVVTSPWLFGLYLRVGSHQRYLRPGLYCLEPWTTPRQLVAMLRARKTCPALMVRRGESIFSIARRLVAFDKQRFGDFLKQCRDFRWARQLGIPVRRPSGEGFAGTNLRWMTAIEGYLPPGLHLIHKSDSSKRLLERLVPLALKRWHLIRQRNLARYQQLKRRYSLTEHQFIILASLVEKEALLDGERRIVVSVFYNRLRKGWRIDSDPTLVYHPKTFDQRPRPVHRRDKTNPFNTYARVGLPAGPIAVPGLASLEAVLNPAQTDYMFFVARGDGSRAHRFSKTLTEHNAAVKLFIENVKRRRRR